jgi:hypothetical protein
MRRCLAGIFILLLTPVVAFAQVRGEVESVGFQNRYRPDCWTPMTVKLIPETGKTDFYQIQVKQEDLDRDRAVFTRTVSVTGNAEGQSAREQRFRVYFIPQATRGGLPDARDPSMNLRDLDETLVVNLCTESGKLIAKLPVTSSIQSVDPKPGMWDQRRGSKFILAVSEGRAKPVYVDNTVTGVLGLIEDVHMVTVRPDELPENVLGYDAVDAVVWLDADPASLRGGGEDKRRALDAYVNRGGKLVICQDAEWQRTLEFGELLPVEIQGVQQKPDLRPLKELAKPLVTVEGMPEPPNPDPWDRVPGPFRIARAKLKPGAVVDEWVSWSDAAADRSPYIARHRVGLGAVTWVAQDLADPAITSRVRSGWPYVWERVFDWKNVPIVLTGKLEPGDFRRYAPGSTMDLGWTLPESMELPSKTAWLVTLAVVFFIAYWLVAGPGVFAYLVGKKRTQLSWFMFAASALVATGLTVLLVKLVLRGPPELKHFTVVRAAADSPLAVAHGRFGLYIPRDGFQELELTDTAPDAVTTISAWAPHPVFFQSGGRDQQGPEYFVPVVDAAQNQPAKVSVPYSSTLKKLQATWVGPLTGKVEGSATLLESGYIEGSITNGTGTPLRHVYIAFAYPSGAADAGDYMLYVPSWEPGVTLDLNREFNRAGEDGKMTPFVNAVGPEQGRRTRGHIQRDWSVYWYPRLRPRMMEDKFNDWNEQGARRSFPMLSLFDRLPPMRNDTEKNDRVELLRRHGARSLDVSHALAAGALVVLAEAGGPLPFPLEVEGDRVAGDGTTLYQFLLPLDRSKLTASETDEEATTQVTERAAGTK